MISWSSETIDKVQRDVVPTITDIETAVNSLSDHLSDLASAIKGMRSQIPDRLENWQSVLNGIKGELEETQQQLQTLVRLAGNAETDVGL